MRKRLISIVVLVGIAASLGAADPKSEGFFPMTKGTEWIYATKNKEKKDDRFEMKVVIEGPWKKDGLKGMIMTQTDPRGKMRQFLLKNKKGIFAAKLALSKTLTPEINTRFTPALPTVIFPLIPGTKVHWQGRLKVTGLMNKPIVLDGAVVDWEDLDVPAGHFHCIKLHFHEKRGDDIIDEDVWYAEGVGQVKYDGGQYVKELKAFKKP